MKYSRPCAVRVTRRVVRLSSDTPSSDSSTDNRRLTVEIGIPNERDARLMLSNWATLTNIRILSRSAIASYFATRGNKIPDFPSFLNHSAQPENRFSAASPASDNPFQNFQTTCQLCGTRSMKCHLSELTP